MFARSLALIRAHPGLALAAALIAGVLLFNIWQGGRMLSATGIDPATGLDKGIGLQVPASSTSISATGKIESMAQVSVGSEISGKIAEVYVDFNDHVRAGQKLAKFQIDHLEAAVAEAEAMVKMSAAEVGQAEATRSELLAKQQRRTKLAKGNFVSPQQLEESNAELSRASHQIRLARAKLEAQTAALRHAQSNLDRATIVSPIDGIVLDRLIEPGQTVAAGLETPNLFVIARDLKDIRIRAFVDEADIGLVRQGQPVKFWVDAYPGQIFQGQVQSIHRKPTTIQNVVFYEVIVSGSNPKEILLPGMTATLKIAVDGPRT